MKKNGVYSEYLKDRKTIMTMVSMTFAFAIVIILSFGTNFYFRELGSDFFVDIAVRCLHDIHLTETMRLRLFPDQTLLKRYTI